VKWQIIRLEKLMSYGVSSLTTNIMAIAILLNIQLRRQKLLF